jgi:hypothetical protein
MISQILPTATPDFFGAPSVFVAPADLTVAIDGGPASGPGNWRCYGSCLTDDAAQAITNSYAIVHRNAANSADIAVVPFLPQAPMQVFIKLALNERILLRKFGAPTAASTWQTELWLYSLDS